MISDLAQGVLQVVVLFSFAYGLISLLEAGKARVRTWWAMRRVPRRGLAPVAWVRDMNGKPVALEQRDYGDETDIVAEGLGVTRPQPRAVVLPPGHPGDVVTPLAYLDEPEWRLWTSVIAASAR